MARDEPLFSKRLRDWVECEFAGGRGRRLKAVRRALEQRVDGPGVVWRGNILNLDLDRSTNLLTVSVEVAAEVEPETVDYEEFKRFVLRERP